MRRIGALSAAAALSLIGGVVGTAAGASAGTDSTVPGSTEGPTEPGSTEAHPMVGMWNLTDAADDTSFVAVFGADGTFVQVEDGDVGLGVWEPTGPSSAALTILEQLPAEEAGGIKGATVTIRATIEVDADGQGLSADYTIEVSGVEGMPTGEHGPGSVTGTRVTVEPMGSPVGSLEDLFGSFDDDSTEGTVTGESTGPASTGGPRGVANVERYCALTKELDEAGGEFFAELEADDSATDEDYAAAERRFIEDHQADFDELREVAPAEIASDVEVLLAAQEQRAAGGEQEDATEEAAAAEERVVAFEDEYCTTS